MKHTTLIASLTISVTLLLASACKARTASATDNTSDEALEVDTTVMKFDADSAYEYIDTQVAFGPRVSGTEANKLCGEYLISELTRHNAQNVRIQTGDVTAYNGDLLPITNIMGSYRPELSRRILLVAHYDTRPWADADQVDANRLKPVPGANDGASGVGVILELARIMGKHQPPVGVDILFVDAEDYGQSEGFSNHDESWALGTQHWVRNMPYHPDSLPAYGVLLDMVGGMDAKFHREYFSDKNAPGVVDKVWSIASRSGYGAKFVNIEGGAVVDDHVFLNRAGIPTIDIIESNNTVTRSFNPTWHTLNDDMDHIDRNSLKAVGQTVTNLIYSEKP
ncbi:MAG: M28 family peptidase [Muribaculaceae bacterium]|nr:M28 family peptidase [Muribaculaceae bacterium]